jgi:hypothetical protein
MNLDLDDLEQEQVSYILKKLAQDDVSITSRIQEIIKQLDSHLDATKIADEIFERLDAIDVEDLWHQSGSTRYGYVEPCEKAYEMVEETISPFIKKLSKYLSTSMWEEAKTISIGIVKGLYEYDTHSESEFKDWAPDVVDEMVGNVIDEWKDHCKNEALLDEIEKLIAEFGRK